MNFCWQEVTDGYMKPAHLRCRSVISRDCSPEEYTCMYVRTYVEIGSKVTKGIAAGNT